MKKIKEFIREYVFSHKLTPVSSFLLALYDVLLYGNQISHVRSNFFNIKRKAAFCVINTWRG